MNARKLESLRKKAQSGNTDAMEDIVSYYIDTYKNGKTPKVSFQEAFDFCQDLMSKDGEYAYTQISVIFWNGYGCQKDFKKALAYLTKGASLGFRDCAYGAGYCLSLESPEKDIVKAEKYLLDAESKGDLYATKILAEIYVGRGDYMKATQCSLILQNNDLFPEMKVMRANMYFNGDGVTQDKQKAISLYREAASCGSGAAFDNLSVAYFYGDGVPVNKELAVRLSELSDFCRKKGWD